MIITNNCPTLCVMLSRLDSKKGQNLITWYMDDIQNTNTKYSWTIAWESWLWTPPLPCAGPVRVNCCICEIDVGVMYVWWWSIMSLTMITMYQCYLVLIPCCKTQYYVTQNKMGNEIQCTHTLYSSPHQTPTLHRQLAWVTSTLLLLRRYIHPSHNIR